MAKNLVPEVCRLLGVEVGERFKMRMKNNENAGQEEYIITRDGRLARVRGEVIVWYGDIMNLLNGYIAIVKLPWKPKDSEWFYTFGTAIIRNPKIWIVVKAQWRGSACDIAMMDKGWIYRTKEEAEAALPKVAEELGAEYEI